MEPCRVRKDEQGVRGFRRQVPSIIWYPSRSDKAHAGSTRRPGGRNSRRGRCLRIGPVQGRPRSAFSQIRGGPSRSPQESQELTRIPLLRNHLLRHRHTRRPPWKARSVELSDSSLGWGSLCVFQYRRPSSYPQQSPMTALGTPQSLAWYVETRSVLLLTLMSCLN